MGESGPGSPGFGPDGPPPGEPPDGFGPRGGPGFGPRRGGGGPGGPAEMIARRGVPSQTRRRRVDFSTLPLVRLPEVRDLPPNGLAPTPPMGWNSWNKFRTRIDDKTIREIADAMVASGMKDAG